jgi:ATP-dependent RNA helicase YTHDC2
LDTNCEIISLHNEMQSNDLSKAFTTLPNAPRKIVLATNLAESLPTIDNVQYVIDTGRERVQTFESETRVTSSKIGWITKTSALQRKSRVTSSADGAIYRLYLRDRYDSPSDEMRLEILESDITKICLFAKLMAKTDSIDDFLQKAITPPTIKTIYFSIKLLQQIGALNPDESISQLGKYLATIPLHVQHAKMLMYGIFFKCIDPMLTIVSILSFECPFNQPTNMSDQEKIEKIKKQLMDGSYSDVFVRLRIFQNWNEYKSTNTFDCIFCEKHFVSPGTLELIALNRVRLVGHLRSLKLIPSVGSIALLNEHSNNWAVIKACITAGAYPNVCMFKTCKFVAEQDEMCVINNNSVLTDENIDELKLNSNIFEASTAIENCRTIETCTFVSNFCLAMMAGNGIVLKIVKMSQESENIVQSIHINDFIQFEASFVTAKLVKYLRNRLHQLFNIFLMDVEKFALSGRDFALHEAVVMLLTMQDEKLGLKTIYKGIGSRPSIVTRDCETSSASNNSSTYSLEKSDRVMKRIHF